MALARCTFREKAGLGTLTRDGRITRIESHGSSAEVAEAAGTRGRGVKDWVQSELISGTTCSPNIRTCSPRSGKPSTSIPAQALNVNESVNETSA